MDSARVRAALRGPHPIVVDLGYGRLPVTTLELADRLRPVVPGVRVVGLEVDPQRVATAQAAAAGSGAGFADVEFRRGGFELAGLRPALVRAFNVLRQYREEAVAGAWRTMQDRLAPDGLILDGTCDELGRLATWLLVDADGPVSLTLACDPRHLQRPSDLAERLPKALIHHNVPGEPVHALLAAADRAWDRAAGQSVFGPRARWRAMLDNLAAEDVPVEAPRRNRRDGVLTVPWATVAPGSPH